MPKGSPMPLLRPLTVVINPDGTVAHIERATVTEASALRASRNRKDK